MYILGNNIYSVCIFKYTYNVCKYVYKYKNIYTCAYTLHNEDVYIYIYIYMYRRKYRHTDIHTYIHTYIT